MLDKIFSGIFDTATTAVISVGDFLLCIGVALLVGAGLAFSYAFRTRYTRSFLVTLGLLPAVVSLVIMMVNGNVGAGVAVAGAFSLVRFRSAPGSAREICTIFIAMGAGLTIGMGYLGYAALFTVIMCGLLVLFSVISVGVTKKSARYKVVRITIPEDLDYSEVFDDVMRRYTTESELVKVKTVNMGSMFRLTYNVLLRDPSVEKMFIDELRERNGNLEITVSVQDSSTTEL